MTASATYSAPRRRRGHHRVRPGEAAGAAHHLHLLLSRMRSVLDSRRPGSHRCAAGRRRGRGGRSRRPPHRPHAVQVRHRTTVAIMALDGMQSHRCGAADDSRSIRTTSTPSRAAWVAASSRRAAAHDHEPHKPTCASMGDRLRRPRPTPPRASYPERSAPFLATTAPRGAKRTSHEKPDFEFDEAMTDLIFDTAVSACRAPVPLDYGACFPSSSPRPLRAARGRGQRPGQVLALYSEQLAPAIVSADSPRFLSFIPARPDQGVLLFDMVVSCSRCTRRPARGRRAVAAENQALRLLAISPACPPCRRLLRLGWEPRQPLRPGGGA